MKLKIAVISIISIIMITACYFVSVRVAYAKSVIEARKYQLQGDFSKAAQCYQKALLKDPQNFEIYKELAEIYRFQDNKTELKSIFEKGIKICPNDKWFLIHSAGLAIDEKDYGKAEIYLKKAIELGKTNGKLLFLLGRVLQEQDKNPEALNTFQEAIKSGYSKSRCYYNMACIYEYGFKNYSGAVKYYNLYTEATGDKGNNISKKMENYSLWMVGQSLEDEGRYKEAAVEYEKKLAENPGNLALMSRLGRAYRKSNNFPESEKIYIKALNIHKNNYYILNNLGSLYYEIERYNDAEACWSDAIKQAPEKPNAHYNIAALYTKKGKYADAEKEYLKAKKLGYSEGLVYLQLSYLNEKYLKNQAKANDYRNKFVNSPDYPEIKKTILKTGDQSSPGKNIQNLPEKNTTGTNEENHTSTEQQVTGAAVNTPQEQSDE